LALFLGAVPLELIVPPRHPLALATALEQLLIDEALRSRFAQASLARARERFGLDTHA
jgi:glycosyltransferase involved in cell wall biosynthesis